MQFRPFDKLTSEVTFIPCFKICIHCPVAMFHILIVASSLPDASCPSGKTTSKRTMSVCPVRDCKHWFVSTSHIVIVLLLLPDANFPFGKTTSEDTAFVFPTRVLAVKPNSLKSNVTSVFSCKARIASSSNVGIVFFSLFQFRKRMLSHKYIFSKIKLECADCFVAVIV